MHNGSKKRDDCDVHSDTALSCQDLDMSSLSGRLDCIAAHILRTHTLREWYDLREVSCIQAEKPGQVPTPHSRMASVSCPTSPTILLRLGIYGLTMALLLAGLLPSGRSDPGIASCSCPNRLSSCPTNIYFFTYIYYQSQR